MKPLLIVPPAPSRWPALRDLLVEMKSLSLDDIERRFMAGVAGAQDVYAVIGGTGHYVACASINKRGDVGVLSHVYTRPDHRRRGYARQLTEAVLSWFDMTGGRWLVLSTTAEYDEILYRKFGFKPLRRVAWAPHDRLTAVRGSAGATGDPYAGLSGEVEIRDVTRADIPLIVFFLQYRPGPDPRVPLSESAVTAKFFAQDLMAHREKNACLLMGAFQGARLVGLATLAIDKSGDRTYAMMMPHTDAPDQLRQAVLAAGRDKGYTHVDFPMETLAPTSDG